MLERRRDDVQTVFVYLSKNKRTHQVHVRDAAKPLGKIAECQNASALPTLTLSVFRKQRFNQDPGILVGRRPKIDRAGRTTIAEVFSAEGRIGASIDRPVERFAKRTAF